MRTSLILFLTTVATCLIASGCGGGASNNNVAANTAGAVANSNAAKTNIEELGMAVNVPYKVDDLVWKEYPAQKRILAVLRISSEDVSRVVSDASAAGQAENVSIPSQAWFPDELIAQAEMSGDNALKGQAYPANAFYQDPYNSGRVIRIEGTEFFVLDLTAK